MESSCNTELLDTSDKKQSVAMLDGEPKSDQIIQGLKAQNMNKLTMRKLLLHSSLSIIVWEGRENLSIFVFMSRVDFGMTVTLFQILSKSGLKKLLKVAWNEEIWIVQSFATDYILFHYARGQYFHDSEIEISLGEEMSGHTMVQGRLFVHDRKREVSSFLYETAHQELHIVVQQKHKAIPQDSLFEDKDELEMDNTKEEHFEKQFVILDNMRKDLTLPCVRWELSELNVNVVLKELLVTGFDVLSLAGSIVFSTGLRDHALSFGQTKMVAKERVKYFVVDAFADSAFKGNPAAVCFLEDDNQRDDVWLQSLAAEFNLSETCFLTPITVSDHSDFPRFRLRWFTPVAEVDLCGHATLASAHVLFSNSLVDSDVVEFDTNSGILTAKRVPLTSELKESTFLIELDFPVVPTCEINSIDDLSVFSNAVNGATIVDIKATEKDILVVLSSWESVTGLQPRIDEISKCPCEGLMVTAAASEESQYDFCSRYFAPIFGINEDPVTGSAHCALAHYWSTKMNKCDFLAYQASSRGGTLKVHLDKEKQRVLLRGKAVTVMEGCVLV